jgi:hypothetical protein
LSKEKAPALWLFASLVLFALIVFGASSCGGAASEQSVEEGAEDEPQAGERTKSKPERPSSTRIWGARTRRLS